MPGMCECGCGERTKLATRTQASKGHVRGLPHRFILGHRIRLHAAKLNRDRAIPWRERVIENASGCLVWTGATNSKGYGLIGRMLAHRHVWEEQHGPIPGRLTIDHVRARGCTDKRCLNTAHMELVTRAENSRRRWRRDARAAA